VKNLGISGKLEAVAIQKGMMVPKLEWRPIYRLHLQVGTTSELCKSRKGTAIEGISRRGENFSLLFFVFVPLLFSSLSSFPFFEECVKGEMKGNRPNVGH
jgi:hypothetical protein